MEIGVDLGLVVATYGLLFFAGFGYNVLVERLEQHGYHEGYLSLLVAGGVGFTLAGVAILDLRAAVLALGAFVASGSWMILGSIWRYVRARERAARSMIDEVVGDQGAELAE